MLFAAPFLAVLALPTASPIVSHDLDVELAPADGRLSVVDRLTLPESVSVFDFVLHAGLEVSVDGGTISASEQEGFEVGAQRLRVTLKAPQQRVTVRYRGVIAHPPQQVATEHQRSFEETPGTIEARGVYLARGALWFPQLIDEDGPIDELFMGAIRVRGLPKDWGLVSEGDLRADGTYAIRAPVDDLHLVASAYTSHLKEKTRGIDTHVYLRGDPNEDRPLAQRYIEATTQYLALYEELLGAYPYSRFALVENFWETGYGMPSFTLLGPQVVRFPFILRSSYPHELLHNWWGNGVFIDGEGGNWAEGLTAYLADHLMADIEGRGVEHRRATLERYQDFVDGAADFSLYEFKGRFSAASEAVGYGKAAMLYHMLRRRLGDERFTEALRRFYRHFKHERARFDDVVDAFEAQGGDEIGAFARDFLGRTGAPSIAWRQVREEVAPNGVRSLTVELVQTQKDAPFFVDVPIVITTLDGRSIQAVVPMRDRDGRAVIRLPGPAARVDVDPFFDVFRTLADGETPPALSRTLGAKKVLFVVPTLASDAEKAAWQRFAKGVCGDGATCTTVVDEQLISIPADASVWVLGYGNTLRGVATGVHKLDARFEDRGFVAPGLTRADRTDPAKTSIALAVPHPTSARHGAVFVGAHSAAAIDPLTRKLPHYGKYGYLTFAGEPVENASKGQWQNASSPLTVFLRDARPALSLKAPPPLRKLPPPFEPNRMLALVNQLAAPAMKGRAGGSKEVQRALDLVDKELKAAGLATTRGAYGVEAVLGGRDAAAPAVVLGAHVDHLGAQDGKVFLGADDNASGVAVLVEVARSLVRAGPMMRTVRFVVFTDEERGTLGSQAYVASLGDAKAKLHSMVNLDTVGRRGERPLLLLDGDSASEWVHVARGVGFTTGVPVTVAKEGGGASDQKRFNEAGVPAVQLFSGPHADYHKPTDSADKVEPASLVDAAVVAREIVAYLADRKEPLTRTGPGAGTGSRAERKATLGTIPDMTFAGPGVRLEGASPGSAAEKADLRAGDVLVRFDDKPVTDLRSYSDLLKQKKPGDRVRIVVRRGDKELALDVELQAR